MHVTTWYIAKMSLLDRKLAQLFIFFVLLIKEIFPLTLKGSSQYAVSGQPYTLICSVPDKTPAVQYRRTPVPPSTKATTIGAIQVSGSDCYNVAVSPAVVCVPAVCSCVSDEPRKGSEFSWTITPDNSMDQSTWYCIDFSSIESAMFTLQFVVPVTSIALQNPPSAGSELTIIEGTSASFICVTSACRPSASVLWYIGETNYTSFSNHTVSDETGNLHITTSTLTINPNRSMNGERINCSAYNYGDNTVTTNNLPRLNVQYPSDTKATMNVSSVSIKEGQDISILCEVKGGNPKAQITWSCFSGTKTDVSTGTNSRSVITVVGSNSQNGQPCICRGQHSLVTITPAMVTFNIVFQDAYEDQEQIDGTKECSPDCCNESPNAASIVLFAMSTLVLGVAVAFGIALYMKYARQTINKTKERPASKDAPNEYDDVQTVGMNASKDASIQMTRVLQIQRKRKPDIKFHPRKARKD